MPDLDTAGDLGERVRAAIESGTPLLIQCGGTKQFYGLRGEGEIIGLAEHRGITNYEPTELVLTARAGTPLADIEAALGANGQMLPFEPPHFGSGATLGGTLACGFSGPRRPYSGAARDFVLGTRVLNGRAEILRFGGEVMKNVAGYDVSRLMVGALGTLGIILEASLKILPRPAMEITLLREESADAALATMYALGGKPHPLSATCFDGERLYVRLSGAESAVKAAADKIGGDRVAGGEAFWRSIREHTHPYFAEAGSLWRVSVPATARPAGFEGKWLFEWGGALRWLRSEQPPDHIWDAARAVGGHATLFRGGNRGGEVFQPLPKAMEQIHRNLKLAFDPDNILNRHRLYTAW